MFRVSSSIRKRGHHILDTLAVASALDKVQAIIWFDLEGNILDANDNFLAAMGYSLDEIRGQHHKIFVTKAYSDSAEYAKFWDKLGLGNSHSGDFARIAKDGSTVWIEASYNPVFDERGKPVKVVKFAIDVTEAKKLAADSAGQLDAISKSQAVIEFTLDGNILTANENFCQTLGYSLEEIKGRHHKIFVSPAYASSAEYRAFWQTLGAGKFHAGEFMRVKKDGREIWIQATYNPILDPAGKPVKIVKFATDITETKAVTTDAAGQLEAISKSQAVIEFDLEGTILHANENFLKALGYSLEEVRGKHHSIFVDPVDVQSAEYADFWRTLRNGQFFSAEYRRIAKGGREIWIQATYNPILNSSGEPYKVVKYASELTDRKHAMDAFSHGLTALSEGDLTVRLPDTLTGDFAALKTAFNTTMVRLEEMVVGILGASEEIADETQAIASSSTDLSARGERQATTLEETSAAMEEISVTVKSTAANAKIANSAAESASRHAQKGGEVVTSAIAAMDRIEANTAEIGKIVEVIDGIAFQTNLLALNAGVEAARAGNAGRGFAVVASEVRALAQLSSDSAREVNELISTSNRQVSEGTELVNRSGEALSEIVAGVQDVVTSISDILSASEEQATGISEVTQAVVDIDRTTQQTAALAEEGAASATQLAERAARLRELVSFFRHDDGGNACNTHPTKHSQTASQNSSGYIGEISAMKQVAGTDIAQPREPAVRRADGWVKFYQ
ncbi:PAS domain S-box protein [uncultured Roseobacter sp.]|uniref:methyl-accepting chemotaxis protein n=1 Tax=uncultured Roseobacter sp. TaxID=114847 RepID=UPI00262C4767|nr:PAS domain S-box protein [uncultured Roseobacter sp.]